jgi:ABC-type spermidine/putrescine transport system permease subunit I
MNHGWHGVLRYAVFVPYLAFLLCLLVAPSLSLLWVSFSAHSVSSITGSGLTLNNYSSVLDPYVLGLIGRTIRLAAFSTCIVLLLAYPPAYVLGRGRGALKTLVSFAVMIPFMTSAVVKVLGWYIVLVPGGPLNAGLAALGLGRVRVLGYEAGVLVGLVEFSLPLMIFSLASAIERIPPQVEEAARNLGAGSIPLFFKVIVPMTWSGMLSGLLLCFGVSASAYVVPLVLGGSRVRMVANEIYDQVLVAFDWPAASAFSLVVALVLGSIGYLAIRVVPQRRA